MKMQTRRTHRFARVLLAGCLLLGTGGAASADDKATVQMQAVVGWDSAYREDALTAVQVIVENQGPDFTGRMVVRNKYDQNTGRLIAGEFEKEVVVPKEGTKQFTMEVPGGLFNEQAEVVLYDQDGKVVMNKEVSASVVRDGMLIGGISAKKDDLNMFSLVNTTAIGGKVTLKEVNAVNLPDRPELLDGLDLLVINHAPQEKITNGQVQAVKQWVENGGRVLLSGGAGYNGGASLLSDLSPVQVTGTQTVSDLSGLEVLGGSKPTAASLLVTTGTLAPGAAVLAKTGDLPLLAERTVGAGKVLYAAYDLSEEPLASWQGNKELWGRVLGGINLNAGAVQLNGGSGGIDRYQGLVQASTMFDNIVPAFRVTLLVFCGYMLIVGPILYIVLKRRNKRDLGWVLIPGTAVLFALGTYLIGTDQRSVGATTQFVGQVELKSENTAKVTGGASFLVTQGGDYQVQLAKGMSGFAARNYYGPNDLLIASTVLGREQQEIRYQDVEYWTLRSAFAQGVLENKGQIDSDLRIGKDGKVTGTLTNNSKFDLFDAHVIIGAEPVKIGELKQGAQVQVDKELKSVTPTFGSTYGDLTQRMFPYTGGNASQREQQQRDLVSYATAPQNYGNAPVQLFAFSETPLDLYSIEGTDMRNNQYYNLVRQVLPVQFEQETSMPGGFLRPQITAQDGQSYLSPDGLRIMIGSVTFQYDVTLTDGFTPEQVTTNLDGGLYAMFEKFLYNQQTGAWDPVTKENTPVLTGDALARYVSNDGKLSIKVKSNTPQEQFLPYPNVGVEGKVSQ